MDNKDNIKDEMLQTQNNKSSDPESQVKECFVNAEPEVTSEKDDKARFCTAILFNILVLGMLALFIASLVSTDNEFTKIAFPVSVALLIAFYAIYCFLCIYSNAFKYLNNFTSSNSVENYMKKVFDSKLRLYGCVECSHEKPKNGKKALISHTEEKDYSYAYCRDISGTFLNRINKNVKLIMLKTKLSYDFYDETSKQEFEGIISDLYSNNSSKYENCRAYKKAWLDFPEYETHTVFYITEKKPCAVGLFWYILFTFWIPLGAFYEMYIRSICSYQLYEVKKEISNQTNLKSEHLNQVFSHVDPCVVIESNGKKRIITFGPSPSDSKVDISREEIADNKKDNLTENNISIEVKTDKNKEDVREIELKGINKAQTEEIKPDKEGKNEVIVDQKSREEDRKAVRSAQNNQITQKEAPKITKPNLPQNNSQIVPPSKSSIDIIIQNNQSDKLPSHRQETSSPKQGEIKPNQEPQTVPDPIILESTVSIDLNKEKENQNQDEQKTQQEEKVEIPQEEKKPEIEGNERSNQQELKSEYIDLAKKESFNTPREGNIKTSNISDKQQDESPVKKISQNQINVLNKKASEKSIHSDNKKIVSPMHQKKSYQLDDEDTSQEIFSYVKTDGDLKSSKKKIIQEVSESEDDYSVAPKRDMFDLFDNSYNQSYVGKKK